MTKSTPAQEAWAKLSEPMRKSLIELHEGRVIAGGPTLAALKRRGLVALIDRTGRDQRTVRLTDAGREAIGVDATTGLRREIHGKGASTVVYVIDRDGEIVKCCAGPDAIERSDAFLLEQAKPTPDPAPRYHSDSHRPVLLESEMGNGCDCDRDGCRVCFPDSGPAVRLTEMREYAPNSFPALYGRDWQPVTDVDVLHVLVILDAAPLTRPLYGRLDLSGVPLPLDRDRTERAVTAGLAWGLIDREDRDGLVSYVARPIHLDGLPCGSVAWRNRVTTDPAEVTCRQCANTLPLRVDEIVRFRHNGAETGRLFRVVETDGMDGDLVRVAWDNPPEDFDGEINARWVAVSLVERVRP